MSYPSNSESVAQDQIRAIVERVERMHEERRAIADDIKEIYAEAKGNGFDVPALKAVIKIRGQDSAERQEQEALIELYMSALGMSYAPRETDGGPRAPARTREIIEEFGADEGADQSTAAGMDRHADGVRTQAGLADESGIAPRLPQMDRREPDEGSDHNGVVLNSEAGTQAPPVDTNSRAADAAVRPSSGVDPSLAGAEGDEDRPPLSDAAQNALRLRPHCQAALRDEITKCGGYGKKHCFECDRLHADAEGQSA